MRKKENIILAETKVGVHGLPNSARGLGLVSHITGETLSSELLMASCFVPVFCLFIEKKIQRLRLVLMWYRKSFEIFNAFSGRAKYFSSHIKLYKCV